MFGKWFLYLKCALFQFVVKAGVNLKYDVAKNHTFKASLRSKEEQTESQTYFLNKNIFGERENCSEVFWIH